MLLDDDDLAARLAPHLGLDVVAEQPPEQAVMVGADHHGFLGRLFGNDVEAEVKREASCEVVVVD